MALTQVVEHHLPIYICVYIYIYIYTAEHSCVCKQTTTRVPQSPALCFAWCWEFQFRENSDWIEASNRRRFHKFCTILEKSQTPRGVSKISSGLCNFFLRFFIQSDLAFAQNREILKFYFELFNFNYFKLEISNFYIYSSNVSHEYWALWTLKF